MCFSACLSGPTEAMMSVIIVISVERWPKSSDSAAANRSLPAMTRSMARFSRSRRTLAVTGSSAVKAARWRWSSASIAAASRASQLSVVVAVVAIVDLPDLSATLGVPSPHAKEPSSRPVLVPPR